jgi:dUTP pyrophosphatase
VLPKQVGKIPTGLSFEFPKSSYGRIAPRSGLSLQNIDVSAGVIDQGECCFFYYAI